MFQMVIGSAIRFMRKYFVWMFILVIATPFMGIASAYAGTSALQAAGVPIPFTPELIASVAALIASLAFAYIPGLKTLYGGLTDEWKAAVMGITLVLIAVAAFGIGCAGWLPELQVSCDRNGIVVVLSALVAALAVNQGTFLLAVKPFKKDANTDRLSNLQLSTPVHYVTTRDSAVVEMAAFVTQLWGTPGLVNLFVPPDGAASAVRTPTSVRYDADRSVGTWHFPDDS